MEYSEFSKTLVKWGSILYKASLTFIFLAILCNSQIYFIMQIHLKNLESKKCGGVKIFIFLPSLSESWDEIPIKWGSLSHPKIFDFGLCLENNK